MKTLRAALFAAGAACAALLAAAVPARAAPPGQVAVICDRGIAPYRALLEGLRSACDCETLVIHPADAALPGLEQRLKDAGVRAVLAVGLQAQAAVEGVRDLPVVLTMVPQVAPWVADRANRSGVEMSLSPRQHLEALRRVFPRARRVGVIFNPAQNAGYVTEALAAAAALNLTLVTAEIARPGELSRHLQELRGRIDVLWLIPDQTVFQGENLTIVLLASFESRIPLYGFARKYVEAGALAALQFDFPGLGAQVAAMLQGPSPPIAGAGAPRWQYARGARLVLNQKVARKMGIVFDPEVLEGAVDVIR